MLVFLHACLFVLLLTPISAKTGQGRVFRLAVATMLLCCVAEALLGQEDGLLW